VAEENDLTPQYG